MQGLELGIEYFDIQTVKLAGNLLYFTWTSCFYFMSTGF